MRVHEKAPLQRGLFLCERTLHNRSMGSRRRERTRPQDSLKTPSAEELLVQAVSQILTDVRLTDPMVEDRDGISDGTRVFLGDVLSQIEHFGTVLPTPDEFAIEGSFQGDPRQALAAAAMELLIFATANSRVDPTYQVATRPWAPTLVQASRAPGGEDLLGQSKLLTRLGVDVDRIAFTEQVQTFLLSVEMLDLASSGLVDLDQSVVSGATQQVNMMLRTAPDQVLTAMDQAPEIAEAITRLEDTGVVARSSLRGPVRDRVFEARERIDSRVKAAIENHGARGALVLALQALQGVEPDKIGPGTTATVHAAAQAVRALDPDELKAIALEPGSADDALATMLVGTSSRYSPIRTAMLEGLGLTQHRSSLT